MDNRKQIILLIDDNINNLKVVLTYLQAYSFEVVTARDGEAGIERAQFSRPDLILLDINMPGIDGFETCRRLQANPKTAGIPIIFMTAQDAVEDKVRGLELGAIDYLTKPIEETELRARVQTHLELRRLRADLEAQVQIRTADLEAEIRQRQKAQEDREKLTNLVQAQSEQLRTLTQLYVQSRQEKDKGLIQSLDSKIVMQLATLTTKLQQVQELLQPHKQLSHTQQALAQLQEAQTILQLIHQDTYYLQDSLKQEQSTYEQLQNNPLLQLSTRENEVLQLVVQGKNHAEIAHILGIKVSTVATYRQRIMQKLQVDDLTELLKLAVIYEIS